MADRPDIPNRRSSNFSSQGRTTPDPNFWWNPPSWDGGGGGGQEQQIDWSKMQRLTGSVQRPTGYAKGGIIKREGMPGGRLRHLEYKDQYGIRPVGTLPPGVEIPEDDGGEPNELGPIDPRVVTKADNEGNPIRAETADDSDRVGSGPNDHRYAEGGDVEEMPMDDGAGMLNINTAGVGGGFSQTAPQTGYAPSPEMDPQDPALAGPGPMPQEEPAPQEPRQSKSGGRKGGGRKGGGRRGGGRRRRRTGYAQGGAVRGYDEGGDVTGGGGGGGSRIQDASYDVGGPNQNLATFEGTDPNSQYGVAKGGGGRMYSPKGPGVPVTDEEVDDEKAMAAAHARGDYAQGGEVRGYDDGGYVDEYNSGGGYGGGSSSYVDYAEEERNREQRQQEQEQQRRQPDEGLNYPNIDYSDVDTGLRSGQGRDAPARGETDDGLNYPNIDYSKIDTGLRSDQAPTGFKSPLQGDGYDPMGLVKQVLNDSRAAYGLGEQTGFDPENAPPYQVAGGWQPPPTGGDQSDAYKSAEAVAQRNRAATAESTDVAPPTITGRGDADYQSAEDVAARNQRPPVESTVAEPAVRSPYDPRPTGPAPDTMRTQTGYRPPPGDWSWAIGRPPGTQATEGRGVAVEPKAGPPQGPDLEGYMRGNPPDPQVLDQRINAVKAAHPGISDEEANLILVTGSAQKGAMQEARENLDGLKARYNSANGMVQGAAEAAIRTGSSQDLQKAAQFATWAHNHIPDNKNISYQVDNANNVIATVTNTDRSEGSSNFKLTPQQFLNFQISQGTDFDHMVEVGAEKLLQIASTQGAAPAAAGAPPETTGGTAIPTTAAPTAGQMPGSAAAMGAAGVDAGRGNLSPGVAGSMAAGAGIDAGAARPDQSVPRPQAPQAQPGPYPTQHYDIARPYRPPTEAGGQMGVPQDARSPLVQKELDAAKNNIGQPLPAIVNDSRLTAHLPPGFFNTPEGRAAFDRLSIHDPNFVGNNAGYERLANKLLNLAGTPRQGGQLNYPSGGNPNARNAQGFLPTTEIPQIAISKTTVMPGVGTRDINDRQGQQQQPQVQRPPTYTGPQGEERTGPNTAVARPPEYVQTANGQVVSTATGQALAPAGQAGDLTPEQQAKYRTNARGQLQQGARSIESLATPEARAYAAANGGRAPPGYSETRGAYPPELQPAYREVTSRKEWSPEELQQTPLGQQGAYGKGPYAVETSNTAPAGSRPATVDEMRQGLADRNGFIRPPVQTPARPPNNYMDEPFASTSGPEGGGGVRGTPVTTPGERPLAPGMIRGLTDRLGVTTPAQAGPARTTYEPTGQGQPTTSERDQAAARESMPRKTGEGTFERTMPNGQVISFRQDGTITALDGRPTDAKGQPLPQEKPAQQPGQQQPQQQQAPQPPAMQPLLPPVRQEIKNNKGQVTGYREVANPGNAAINAENADRWRRYEDQRRTTQQTTSQTRAEQQHRDAAIIKTYQDAEKGDGASPALTKAYQEALQRTTGLPPEAFTGGQQQPGGGQGGGATRPPVNVSSPEEARRLPPGTPFRTPDGRTGVR